MIVLKRPTKKPKIVAICGDGRFDRALVRHVAEKLNGYKKTKSIWIYDAPLVGNSPSALGPKVFEVVEYLMKHEFFAETKTLITVLDREHLDACINALKDVSMKRQLLWAKQHVHRVITLSMHGRSIIIGICGSKTRIEEDLARLAESVLGLKPNSLPSEKKELRYKLHNVYNTDFYEIIKKASIDQLIKYLSCITEPLLHANN